VVKFSPEGKVLMTLGKPGVAGDGPDDLQPALGCGHRRERRHLRGGRSRPRGSTNNRIVKFDKNGKFLKTWGKKGTGPGEFDVPHAIAIDSKGRVFVADRNNNRLPDLRPGRQVPGGVEAVEPHLGIYIDKNDILLRGGLRVEHQAQSRLEARHPHRQPEGRQGHGLHPGPRYRRRRLRDQRRRGRGSGRQGERLRRRGRPKTLRKYEKK
jgi:hypothetical protein